MVLSQLLEKVSVIKLFQTLYGRMVTTHETMINKVAYDSRKVERGDLFVAIRGGSFDGNSFISQAIANGAKAVVTDNDAALPDSFFMHSGVVKIVVGDARVALAKIAANVYAHPAENLMLVGVTGTNGKTTTTHVIKKMLEAGGKKTGLLGTIGNMIGGEFLPASHTTPESLELNGLLRKMADEGCGAAVMEVSSHALHQHRVDGLGFAAAVFTNLTQDHLDYHGSMEEYFTAKRILFDNLGADAYAILNTDDAYGARLHQGLTGKKISYGTNPHADMKAAEIDLSLQGVKFTIDYQGERTPIASQLVGRFNVFNLLAGFAAGTALGISRDLLQKACAEIPPVAGRFEQIVSSQGWIAIVDYAHTPDALEKALRTIHDVRGNAPAGKIITVFGCGGNRDAAKRPLMGAIAARMSNVVIVTSDNPRHEDPDIIINDIMAGIQPEIITPVEIRRETDRTRAVIMALESAAAGDVILVAGKGHEDYQVIGDQKIHFSDRELIQEYLQTQA